LLSWGREGEREKNDPQAFDHDVHFLEEETGERFRLKSKGKLSEIVDLDTIPSVKVGVVQYWF